MYDINNTECFYYYEFVEFCKSKTGKTYVKKHLFNKISIESLKDFKEKLINNISKTDLYIYGKDSSYLNKIISDNRFVYDDYTGNVIITGLTYREMLENKNIDEDFKKLHKLQYDDEKLLKDLIRRENGEVTIFCTDKLETIFNGIKFSERLLNKINRATNFTGYYGCTIKGCITTFDNEEEFLLFKKIYGNDIEDIVKGKKRYRYLLNKFFYSPDDKITKEERLELKAQRQKIKETFLKLRNN